MKITATLFLLTLVLSANAHTYLVSVGIADYSTYPKKINNLNLTTRDARTIVDLYSKNTAVDYAILLNSQATRTRIIKAVKKVFNKAGKDDIVVFFFSGHGYPGGLCAADGNLTYGEIRRAMSQSKCRNKMMFVDACRSGGLRVEAKNVTQAVNAAKKANVMLFLSSRTNEDSIEDPGMTNGYFTAYLQKGLKGAADFNLDRKITARELFNYVHRGVSSISNGKQHPVMWGHFRDTMPVMKW